MSQLKAAAIFGAVMVLGVVPIIFIGVAGLIEHVEHKKNQEEQAELNAEAKVEVIEEDYQEVWEFGYTHPELIPDIKQALSDGVLTQGEFDEIWSGSRRIDELRKKLAWIAQSEKVGVKDTESPFPPSDYNDWVGIRQVYPNGLEWGFTTTFTYHGGRLDGENFSCLYYTKNYIKYDDAVKIIKLAVAGKNCVNGYEIVYIKKNDKEIEVDLGLSWD